jgi:hypothetical protein
MGIVIKHEARQVCRFPFSLNKLGEKSVRRSQIRAAKSNKNYLGADLPSQTFTTRRPAA